ncbi:3-methyladenine DNA glycosylase [Corynebacterium occultum]|uniref:Putative 3-methyladenine DNA glycosylase n=1 Tax=Corynebacterium occultum TaxID=2675219 RepID=A0A6B8W288_9CORY|nr:DNA-3-methyladenine glycosylase [Corynebacterium occultum]QGU06127.1 3-methyladenine DNA glycosylase [Corynebacterium occultum]
MINFLDPADIVAPQLLGCVLTHAGVSIRLTEVEAYLGAEDPAAHTHRGRTERNAAMFGPGGHMYVYLSYGIHRAGNIVCAPEGIGQGCLLRAGEVVAGEEIAYRRRGEVPFARLAQGPGNLGQALDLQLEDNHSPVGSSGDFALRPREVEPEWVSGPRIGITKNAAAPLRFWIPGEKTVSVRRGRPKS